MIYILKNASPIGVATVLGLLVGLLWLRFAGRALPGVGTIIAAALAQFWLAAILAGALILAPTQAGLWVMTLGTAVVIWCGFVLPAVAVALAVDGARVGRILSHVAYWLVAMVVMVVAMRLIGLTAPPV